MESLLKVQKNLKGGIEKAFVNFKKSPKERLSKEYIETRLENLEQDWSEFRSNHIKLIEITKPDQLDTLEYMKTDMYDSAEDKYIEYKTHAKVLLNKFVSQSGSTLVAGSSSSKDKPNNWAPSVKLPKITLPAFSGKYSEWPTFRDLFISLIHKNESLDSVQRMHYLKGHVTGEAEQLIRHIPITESNYTQCWSLLEDRYDNKKYLCNCILKRLFGQRRLNSETANGLKDLLDTTTECLSALRNLDVDVNTWDVIIIYIVTDKLDMETRKQWELTVSSDSLKDLPTFKQFKEFMENRFRALECLGPRSSGPQGIASHTQQIRASSTSNRANVLLASAGRTPCEYCEEDHKLCFCKAFAKLDYDKRYEFVSKNRLCYNCLGANHGIKFCNSPSNCRVCNRRHHSLLHAQENKVTTHTSQMVESFAHDIPIENNSCPSEAVTSMMTCLSAGATALPRRVLLATAMIRAQSGYGQFETIRALLDQGSQASFMTEATVQYLRLKKQPIRSIVSGIGENKSTVARSTVTFTLQSMVDPSFEIKVTAYVLNNITSYLPEKKTIVNWTELKNVRLADPQYHSPNKINILLGAEVYGRIIREGLIKAPSGSLIAQCTAFGWILSGAANTDDPNGPDCPANKITVMHAQVSDDTILKKFWELEEPFEEAKKIVTAEEQTCEEVFLTNTHRTPEGRYVVKLPFKKDKMLCKGGNSREIAVKRFKGLERKFIKDSNFKERYTQALMEYIHLDHMRLIEATNNKCEEAVYLPHHAVIREDKVTTKIRPVFDASSKNDKGYSLNDCLCVGPSLQPELRHLLLKWRTFPIGLVADVVKMYRQVRIADEDTMCQRIVWRDNPNSEFKDYELLTVTFGTASAPYLAVKAMQQIVADEGANYPLAKKIILNSFYMDDLMTGCEEINEGVAIFKELTELLDKGGFQLQKWNSNSKDLLKEISKIQGERQDLRNTEQQRTKEDNKSIVQRMKENSEAHDRSEERNKKYQDIEIKLDEVIKVLGLTWKRDDDSFKYYVDLPTRTGPETKRTILSDIARLFDPLGWAAPSIIMAKMFIQRLWLAGIGWDEEVPAELVKDWNTYRAEIPVLTEISVPRWMGTRQNDVVRELHGFSDASKLAYSAVVYIRTIDKEGIVKVTLLTSKTKVAPIKQRSIPRLELCGAGLLTHLLIEAAKVLEIPIGNVRAWTDSTIVLSWLNKHPSHWKTFVANRVSDILTKLEANQWAHVTSKNNPADCASRGLLPSELIDAKLWFAGPEFLLDNPIIYVKPKDLNISLEQAVKVHVSYTEQIPWDKYSSLGKLLRVIAYCRRFKNYKRCVGHTSYIKKKEIDEALECAIKMCQREGFNREFCEIKEAGYVKFRDSKIKSLTPYIDEMNIMRVGGRLQGSQLEECIKHPIVLPHDAYLTQLLVANAHEKTFHGGPQLMKQFLRTAYWIVGVKSLVKQCIRRCVSCARYRPSFNNQLMGSLPSVRVTPARPFLHSGVDYAGPVQIRTTKGKGHRSYKGYICLFICMVTRAIHLEAVSDMTTQAFIAAFRRFVSRRGHCAQLWSDNGTNFVGAAKELQDLFQRQQGIVEHVEANGTEWHFIPPHAPNFGGLWESGIKSAKHHLKRVIGETTLTYEEMSTLLSQIEACLNSRPITLLNDSDPAEPTALTPGHFLVGEPLICVPDPNYKFSPVSSLNRWQFIQYMTQHFWRRWSQEYLVTLLHRYKWSKQIQEPQVGDVVLVKEDDLPPGRWLMARVVEKHPGPDQLTRVVTLRTRTSLIKRPTSKLCILPVTDKKL